MTKLSQTQERALAKFLGDETMSAYQARESLATLRALVKRGYLRDVTPPGAGGIFSPQTHFKFRIAKRDSAS
jgi:hypothetical protein